MNTIVREMENMPMDVQREAMDFAFFLMAKRPSQSMNGTIKQRWAGTLREFRDQFSSLELQKKAQDWRVENHVAH